MNPRFEVGNVLSTGFQVWAKNFVPFMLITMLFHSPVLIWEIIAVQRAHGLREAVLITEYAAFGGILFNLLASAALTYGAVMQLQGQRATIRGCVGAGFRRFFPVLAITIVASLCIGFALLALVVPGLIVYCMFYVAVPCTVIERPGVTGALSRSRELTAGHRMQIFGLVLIVGLISGGISVLLSLVKSVSFEAYVYSQMVQNLLVGSLGVVMGSVAYHLLRAEKEGTSAPELAAVFD
jgi:hypothetical protein